MGQLVDFGRHVQGLARCLNCRHEWQAVVPFESRLELLECSACGQTKGFFPNQYLPAKGAIVLTCECGNDLLYVLGDGTAFCPSCGESLQP